MNDPDHGGPGSMDEGIAPLFTGTVSPKTLGGGDESEGLVPLCSPGERQKDGLKESRADQKKQDVQFYSLPDDEEAGNNLAVKPDKPRTSKVTFELEQDSD